MLLDYIKGIVDDYEDTDDSNLLESEEYQSVVKERLNEMILKINTLIKMVNMGSDLAKHFIPTMATSGVLMGLSVMSFSYLTEVICDAIYNIRWLSFNLSNRKTILISLINAQNPLKLRFTGGIACNYEPGMKIYKNLYSFAAVMGRLSEVRQIK
ncbi:hypothetical protein Zmor_011501 [Zophobas morio]|uniref:Uncharacterized protein n=1 Tax=Zophobas morio TaxID=2755281 RepID=A0AA38IV75_9CUCU|nr:hypothetical protein Zmor_011501 [Zophobas morio]